MSCCLAFRDPWLLIFFWNYRSYSLLVHAVDGFESCPKVYQVWIHFVLHFLLFLFYTALTYFSVVYYIGYEMYHLHQLRIHYHPAIDVILLLISCKRIRDFDSESAIWIALMNLDPIPELSYFCTSPWPLICDSIISRSIFGTFKEVFYNMSISTSYICPSTTWFTADGDAARRTFFIISTSHWSLIYLFGACILLSFHFPL